MNNDQTYSGSIEGRTDRSLGIRVGGHCLWLVEPEPVRARITAIEIDSDGDPRFDLTFDDRLSDHKDVQVFRDEIYPVPGMEACA